MPATTGEPWQTWKRVPDRKDRSRKVSVLTPGEWLTPAGAVYLWPSAAPGGPIWPHARPLSAACAGLWTFMVI